MIVVDAVRLDASNTVIVIVFFPIRKGMAPVRHASVPAAPPLSPESVLQRTAKTGTDPAAEPKISTLALLTGPRTGTNGLRISIVGLSARGRSSSRFWATADPLTAA